MADVDIKKELARINQKLTTLLNQPKQETWVTPAFIQELTGWNWVAMKRARDFGYVKFKGPKGNYLYLIESLNPIFIINPKYKTNATANQTL